MITNFRRIAAALLGLFLTLALFVPAALSEGELTVELPVKISAEGTLPKTPETYVVRMTALDKNAPMPNHHSGGSYDLSVTGPSEASFPPIEYSGVGIYTYKIEQIAGSYPDCKYDERVYIMKTTVTNALGGGYELAVALREEGKDEKPDIATFHNIYKTIEKPTTPPGKPTPTGVGDSWPLYLAGAAALMIVAGYIVYLLCRKEEQ